MTNQNDHFPDRDDILAAVREAPGRFTAIGWVLIALGLVAVLFPLIASIAVKVMVGWFLLITGAGMLYHAFQARRWRSALLSGLIGVLHLAAGVYLAFFPLTGLVGLTALMAVLFLIQGGVEGAIALQHRGEMRGWTWLMLSGVASGVLGVLLLAGLPGTAAWALGLMLGLNFLTSGVSFLSLVQAAKRQD